MIALIAAVAKNGIIGNKGEVPFHLPGDLKRFKEITTRYQNVVAGRITCESIGRYRHDSTKEILPGRKKFVLTRDPKFTFPNCEIVRDPAWIVRESASRDFIVIGGEEIYKIFLPHTDLLFLTRVDVELDGDAQFPFDVFNQLIWRPAYDPLNMIAEMDPGDQYRWYIEDLEQIR